MLQVTAHCCLLTGWPPRKRAGEHLTYDERRVTCDALLCSVIHVTLGYCMIAVRA